MARNYHELKGQPSSPSGVLMSTAACARLLALSLVLAIGGCYGGHMERPRPHLSHAGRICSPSGFGQRARCY